MNVLISYSTREISKNSSFSVSRLLYFLYKALEDHDINVYCYSFSNKNNLTEKGLKTVALTFFHKIINKFYPQYRRYYFNKIVYNIIKNKNIDLVVCVTFEAFQFYSKYFKDEQIIYWTHNYPSRASIDDYLRIVTKKKFFMVTPSINLYKRLWNEFNPETLPFYYKHIPNIALPSNTVDNKVESYKQFDFEYKNRINFLHVSGSALNKGLHLILKTFLTIKSEKEINFIYIGNGSSVKKIENVTLIELPKMPYNELIELYNIADFGIISSLWFETAPLTLHEMLENNVIPIITKSGGMEEITINTKYFTIEYPNNIDEWGSVITKCLTLSLEEIKLMKNENFVNYSKTKLSIMEWGKLWVDFLKKITK